MNLEGLTEKRRGKKSLWYEDDSGNIVAKACSKCIKVKSLDDFAKSSTNLGGRESRCKNCRSEERKVTPLERTRNRPKLEERNGITGKICSDCCSWNALDYFHYHKTKLGNRESTCKICKHKRKRNWKLSNPVKLAVQDALRRARKVALPNTLTASEYEITLNYFGHACALTGASFGIEVEHAIPISVGHGGTTFENCYPMANGLNQSKNNRNIFEWFEANRQRFNLDQERFDSLIEWLGKANGMTVEEYRDYVYECHANPNVIDEEVAM
jgi:hypothetical protein